MAYRWNENDPTIYGPEPIFSASGSSRISTISQAKGFRFRSSVAEIIEYGYIYSPGVEDIGRVGMEIYAAGNEVPQDVRSTIIQPTGQANQVGITEPAGFAPGGNPPPTAHNFVNNWPYAYGGVPGQGATQYLRFRAPNDPDYGTGDARIDLTYGDGDSIPSNRRILSVEILAHVAAVDPGSSVMVTLVDNSGDLVEALAMFFPQVVEDQWAPQFGDSPVPTDLQSAPSFSLGSPPSGGSRFWTVSDVNDLSSSSGLHLRFERVGKSRVRIYNAAVRVWHCKENREAAGLANWSGLSAGDNSWRWYGLRDPKTQTTSWDKTVGDKTMIIRSLTGSNVFSNEEGQVGWSWLQSNEEVNLDGVAVADPGSMNIDISSNGATLVAGEPNARQVRPFAFSAPNDTLSMSVDGEPYSNVAPLPLDGGGIGYGQQITTGPVGGTYNSARFMLRPKVPIVDIPEEQLLLVVRSEGSGLGNIASAYMYPTDLSDVGVEIENGWWIVTLKFNSPLILEPNTQYFVSIASTVPGSAWEIQSYYVTNDVTGLIPALTYGGINDATIGWVGVGVPPIPNTESDAPIVFLMAADPVTNFVIEESIQTMSALGSCDCETPISSALLSWDKSSDPTVNFYEIQRRSASDNVWHRVAQVVDPSWHDFGFERGTPQDWRVRALRSDGSFSEWTDPNSATIGGSEVDPEIIITAGTGGTTIGFTDVRSGGRATRDYEFMSADDVEYRRLHGRDYMTTTRPPEYRGVQFERTLLIQDCAPGCPGLSVLDALKEVERSDVEALTIIEECGNVYYASLVILSAELIPFEDGGMFALVDVEITEVQGDPPLAMFI